MDANGPIRNRIVINLDSPAGQPLARGQSTPRRTPRWLKVLAILGLLVLVILAAVTVGGYLWWRNYQSSPAYSLALMIDAAQRDDMAEFQKRIDEDEIARNMVAAVGQRAAGRYGVAMSGSVQQQIDKLMPSLLPRLKQTIHEEVAKEIKELAGKAAPKPFIVVALAIPSFVTITRQGDTAKASTLLPERALELTMRRDADRWKVTEFDDDVLIQRVVDSVMKEFPPIGGLDLNIPLLKTGRKHSRRNTR
jgi:hypothetical protein